MRAVIPIIIATLTLGPGYGPMLMQAQAGDVPGLESIHMIDALTGWAVTHEPGAERLLHTTDGGTQWRDVTPLNPSGRQMAVGDVAALTSLIAWVSSSDGISATATQTFHTVNGGQTWKNLANPAPGAMHFINAHDGWSLSGVGALGSEEVDIYHSTDGGETWIQVATTTSGNESSGLPFAGNKGDVTFLNATTGWVTGYVLTPDWVYLYVTHDGGRTWRQQNLPLPSQMTPHWNDFTMPPRFFTSRDGVLPVFYSIENESYNTVAADVMFYVTHDGGATWTYTTPVSVTQWFRPLSFADVNHGWVAEGDALYATSDGGRTWAKIQPTPPSGTVRQLDFISPQVGWVVSQTSPFLLKTVDGGHTWKPVTYTISRK